VQSSTKTPNMALHRDSAAYAASPVRGGVPQQFINLGMKYMKSIRRKDREISNKEAIQILSIGEYGFLSTVDSDNMPYGVPLNYIFRNNCIEFHGAIEGYNVTNLNQNPNCSFCVVGKTEVLPDKFTTNYESVIVSGQISELTGEEKRNSLIAFLKKYSPNHMEAGMKYIEKRFDETRVFSIRINKMKGKANK
jgi:nitroimidazol reductase NimA-like FMN-containing flavoprotein (pyridoxamine 5'-phosphate oxidase superfamily)